jgi:hypothetical protein
VGAPSTVCGRCGLAAEGASYEVRADGGVLQRCLRCALLYPPLVRRGLTVAAVVGTLLTAINQGNVILAGDLPAELAGKVPLTYMVPYCVATVGALMNARRTL